MNTIALGEVAEYESQKIPVSELDNSRYIGVDNLLPNKEGIVKSEYLAVNGNASMVRPGNILIGNIRPYLKKIWLSTFTGGSSQDVLNMRVTNPKYLPEFVYYNLIQDLFFKHMMNGSKGSKMPRGDKKQILAFPIPEFDLKKQRKIVDYLSLIDEKIRINRQMIEEIDLLSRSIYDYWFVQFAPFDRSGHGQDLPNGFEMKYLKDFASIRTGKRDANFATEGGKYPFWTTAQTPVKSDEYSFEGKSILIAGNGSFYVNYTDGKFEAYQRTYVIQSSKWIEPLFFSVQRNTDKFRIRSNGSVIKFIILSDVENVQVPFNEAAFDEFSEIVGPLLDEMLHLKVENQELEKQRDWAIPLLMSGQIDIR